MNNLKIKDSEFYYIGDETKAFAALMEECLAQYRSALKTICENGIKSGAVHDGLVLYQEYAEKLCIISNNFGGKYKKIVTSFIDKIEIADSYLYDAGISDVVRDFSDEQYEHLVSCLDDPWFEWTDSAGDWIYSKLLSVLNLSSAFDDTKAYLQDCHRLLLDYNDETAQGLEQLFNAVREIDSEYSVSIPGCGGGDYYTSNFAYTCLTLCGIRDLMNEMADIIDPQSGSFNPTTIEERLGKVYKDLVKWFENTINIDTYGEIPTTIQISDFASQPWADSYFYCFFTATGMFVTDMGGYDAFKMVVYNMFDNAKVMATTGDDYNAYLRKKQIMEIIEEMSEYEYYTDSEEQELVDEARTFLKYVEKYGQEAYDYLNENRLPDGSLILDGRTVEARQFREFLDSVGNAGDILKYGDEGLEYLSRLFADYSKGIEILDSFESNFSGDPEMEKSLEEIRALYSKEFGAWTEEALEKYKEIGYDLTVDAIAEANPVGAVLKTIEETIDVFGEVSGSGTKAKSMYEALIYYDIEGATREAYGNALQTYLDTDPNSEDFAVAERNLRNCFELTKQNNIKLLKAMAEASSGTKKSYYEYCAKQAELMSMTDSTEPDIMTYEQFLKI